MQQETAAAKPERAGYLYYRHRLPVRIMHWINVIALTILLMSGLNIFGAHPSLYWGKSSYAGRPVYEDFPQYSEGCALKMLSPLMRRIVKAMTLSQCMMRTGSACR